ncbi:alpha/beta hydrolase fold [Ruminococcus sp. YRD2003]|uniref:alpha/beta fold hydrolase n=1 Tax=Ruminococcus sp. YRD2003 TaxID=1452313 RepID=UPI0008CB4ACE|nr:alpha/beta hydrolase fold [Ruminococcus flavefaciens]
MNHFVYEGKKVFYKETGSGKPLIFLHGNTASSRMFEQISDKYSKDFRVILIDFLGHGKSDRLDVFPSDLWFYEAQQIIAFLKEKQYQDVNIIGSSGGAMVAINIALEAPKLVNKIIADSFEGEFSSSIFTQNLLKDRENAKNNAGARGFYEYMHGSDWEQIVDNDTSAIIRHQKEIGHFFHKQLESLETDILLTGSTEDKFMYSISDHYYEKVYGDIVSKIKNGSIHLFSKGDHPAIISCFQEFYPLSIDFLLS